MKSLLEPSSCFGFCKIAGFGLLFAYWVKSGETAGFFLLLFLTVMALLRRRAPRLRLTVFVDFIVCAALAATGELPGVIFALPLFEAMYLGYYWSAAVVSYALITLSPPYIAIFVLTSMSGFFLSRWEQERRQKQLLRDTQARRYYELESLQGDLVAALAQIEQMTAVHERARIARDIHDNAGHEIVAAFMSFQAIQNMLPPENTEMLKLYDAALGRLNIGADKIREAVHNLSTVSFLGVDRLCEKCDSFSPCEIEFKVYGDTSRIPIYIWSMLESCLSEALTNIARHSTAAKAMAELDVTTHIVRLCVTNDGISPTEKPWGSGLRNLRHRAAAIGGNLSVDSGETFSVVCVVPIRMNRMEDKNETADC